MELLSTTWSIQYFYEHMLYNLNACNNTLQTDIEILAHCHWDTKEDCQPSSQSLNLLSRQVLVSLTFVINLCNLDKWSAIEFLWIEDNTVYTLTLQLLKTNGMHCIGKFTLQ